MFEGGGTADRSAVVSLAEVECRGALARGPGRLSIQEQLDWGEALLAIGDRASARILIQAAFIQQGFSPQLERSRPDLSASLGVKRGRPPAPTPDRSRGNTVDIAIAELRTFAQTLGASIATSLSSRRPKGDTRPGLHPTAMLARGASLPSEHGVADLVGRAFSWLRPAASDQGEIEGVSAIEALRGAEADPLRWTAAGLAGAAPMVLASAIAVQELRAFLRINSDLLRPSLGSPATFRATTAFDSAGLGPYFSNVGQIIRRSANLFELAAIAEEAASAVGESIGEEAWLALLSRGLSGSLWLEVIDELGDRNASLALSIILERTLAVPSDDMDRPLVARIRDAALDNLDYGLASAAQQALANLDPNDMLERRILGSIQASAGRFAAADQLLSACLKSDPEDRPLHEEVEANRARRYAPFALTRGFGSPRDRQLKRLYRRGASGLDSRA